MDAELWLEECDLLPVACDCYTLSDDDAIHQGYVDAMNAPTRVI